ncbi:unnamed protein product [Adineta steineri]|uniref:Uncharacterized protein n=1 Tax=Adineta steineri TaxID=433720 RepID=A0A813UM02_9BILA|nr:unnamed protein product [Adineta steineri]CAF3939413.1 unnamed protein product [Adineta steineri]CAF4126996.1 unnamed protein product [Adineta steineri]
MLIQQQQTLAHDFLTVTVFFLITLQTGLQQHTVVRTQHRGPQQQGPQQEQQQGSQHGLQQESQHEQQHGSQHELQQGLLQQPQPQHDERQQAGILIVIM